MFHKTATVEVDSSFLPQLSGSHLLNGCPLITVLLVVLCSLASLYFSRLSRLAELRVILSIS